MQEDAIRLIEADLEDKNQDVDDLINKRMDVQMEARQKRLLRDELTAELEQIE